MFDFNAVVNAAIAQAVNEALLPLQQEYANKMGEMAQKIAQLEAQLADGLTAAVSVTVDEERMVEALDKQEWFWEKLCLFVVNNSSISVEDLKGFQQRLADAEDRLEKITTASDERVQEIVEQAIDEHCTNYDHDDYDRAVEKIDDLNFDEDAVEDKVRDLLDSATIRIR